MKWSKWNQRSFGFEVPNSHLNNLGFADDIALLAKYPQELQAMVKELNTGSGNIGLKMNKSKPMFTNTTTQATIVDASESLK